MRTLLSIAAALVNFAIAVGAAALALTTGASVVLRLVAALLCALAVGVSALLLLARSSRLPVWGSLVMRLFCIGFPLVWFLGSLDLGIISGQEFLSVLVVAALYWASWRIFRLSVTTAV